MTTKRTGTGTGPKPLTRQRSCWEPMGYDTIEANGRAWPMKWWQRQVGDGLLLASVAEEPAGWHLAISFRDRRRRYTRYPRWDEITHARYELLPGDVDVVMHLPPPDEYLAAHPTTFHLHEHPGRP